MKRIKVLLTAVVVVTVVGGALAFQAQNAVNGNLRCTFVEPDDTNNTVCTVRAFAKTDGTQAWCTLTSAPTTAICTETKVEEAP